MVEHFINAWQCVPAYVPLSSHLLQWLYAGYEHALTLSFQKCHNHPCKSLAFEHANELHLSPPTRSTEISTRGRNWNAWMFTLMKFIELDDQSARLRNTWWNLVTTFWMNSINDNGLKARFRLTAQKLISLLFKVNSYLFIIFKHYFNLNIQFTWSWSIKKKFKRLLQF